MNSLPAWMFVIGFNLFILHSSGQASGQRLLKLRIVDLNDSRIPFSKLLLSYLPFLIAAATPYLGPVVWLVAIASIFREDRRGCHDLIAGTWMIKA